MFRLAIVKESVFDTYEGAIAEFDRILRVDIQQSNACICTHAIEENCFVQSKENGKILIIGNKCIKNFFPSHMQEEADRLFKIAKRKTQDCSHCKKRFTKEDGETFCETCRKFWKECLNCSGEFYRRKEKEDWKKWCIPCLKVKKPLEPKKMLACLFDSDSD